MNCDQVRRVADASVDSELDLVHEAEIEAHLKECGECARFYLAERETRAALQKHDLYWRAPAGLDRNVRQALGMSRRTPPRPFRYQRWVGLAAAALIVLVAGVTAAWMWRAASGVNDPVVQEAVAAHIRSLLPGHLTDVPSSDQHTVKPWFAGRIDFSPPVPDFTARGFTLVGGRLDYVDGRTVAVSVYRRRQHIVNVFMWPAGDVKSLQAHASRGYNVIRWSRNGVAYCLVSDVNADELRQFAAMLDGGP